MTARTTLHNPRLQQSRSNVLPLTKYGWKCLKSSCWVAFLNDKDGGFTLVHENYVPQVYMEVLNSRWYREVDPEMYRSEFVTKQYKNLCTCVERVMGEGDGVARNLFRSFVRRGASSIATLDLTVKSHKGAGFVTFRNIHSYCLEGLSQWAARELRSWLHTRCHTRQFVKLMSTQCAKPDETLYRLDAKEFFMSGRHPELVDAGTSMSNLVRGRTGCGKSRKEVEWAWPTLVICVTQLLTVWPRVGAPILSFSVSMVSDCMFDSVTTFSSLALIGDCLWVTYMS